MTAWVIAIKAVYPDHWTTTQASQLVTGGLLAGNVRKVGIVAQEAPRWLEITPSQFPREAKGLALILALLPDTAPFRAWASFEFRDGHSKWHEVDLLELRLRLHLVEPASGQQTPVAAGHGVLSHRIEVREGTRSVKKGKRRAVRRPHEHGSIEEGVVVLAAGLRQQHAGVTRSQVQTVGS